MYARRLPARHGFLWLLASFRLFRANPPLLSALTMAYLFLVFAVNALPRIGPFLVPLALPAMILVIANGCRAIERGGGIGSIALMHGVKAQRVALVRLGGLHLLGAIIILFASTAIEGGQISLADSSKTITEEEMIGIMARLFVIALPVIAAFWFAPLLTGWEGVAPLKSIFFSFVAAWRNWRAFAVYVLAVIAVAVVLPGLLLITVNAVSKTLVEILSVALKVAIIFVLAPTMMASVYISYQDVFHRPSEGD
jgi:hypothetical protein